MAGVTSPADLLELRSRGRPLRRSRRCVSLYWTGASPPVTRLGGVRRFDEGSRTLQYRLEDAHRASNPSYWSKSGDRAGRQATAVGYRSRSAGSGAWRGRQASRLQCRSRRGPFGGLGGWGTIDVTPESDRRDPARARSLYRSLPAVSGRRGYTASPAITRGGSVPGRAGCRAGGPGGRPAVRRARRRTSRRAANRRSRCSRAPSRGRPPLRGTTSCC